ncbi:hypothetical protein LH51_17245, partial [Nitrincola sp. A-D6]|uniref:PAS domain S-box protein n=1 Tax=Nitrincola sp. A-D6 TaxID=1545442 RepID=UPI00051FDE66
MKCLSRSAQSLLSATALLVLSLGLILFLALFLLQKANRESEAASVALLQESLNEQLELNAEALGDNLLTFMEQAGQSSELLASLLGQTAKQQGQLNRLQVQKLTAASLVANSLVSSAYVHFETESYDGMDSVYAGVGEHSSAQGSLEVYWVREAQGIVFYPSPDAASKYSEVRDAFGQRESEWYLCPKEQLAPCLTEPYAWELNPGELIDMISLTKPILVNDKFAGVAGVDLNLDSFQRAALHLVSPVFAGQAKLLLLSQQQRILAASDYPDARGQYLDQISPELANYLASSDEKAYQSDEETYLVKQLPLSLFNTEWTLVLMLPMQNTYTGMEALHSDLISRNTRSISILIVVSGLVLSVSLVIALRYVRQRESALNRSRNQLETIFNAAPSPMAVASYQQDHFKTKRVNKAWLREFGYTQSQVLGSNGEAVGWWCSDSDRQRVTQQILDQGGVNQFQVWLQRADGSVFLASVSASTIELGNEKMLVMVYDNVTQTHHLQQQQIRLNRELDLRVKERTLELEQAIGDLEVAQQELIQSGKLAALGNLVAGIAHELNTPVGNAVMASSRFRGDYEELRRKVAQGMRRSDLMTFIEQGEQTTDILTRNLQRAAELINSFKQVAVDQTTSQQRRCSLNEVVHNVLLMLQPTIRKTPHQVINDLQETLIMDTYPA